MLHEANLDNGSRHDGASVVASATRASAERELGANLRFGATKTLAMFVCKGPALHGHCIGKFPTFEVFCRKGAIPKGAIVFCLSKGVSFVYRVKPRIDGD